MKHVTDYIERFLFGFSAILLIHIFVLLVFPFQGSVLAKATYHYYCMNEQGLLLDRLIGMTGYDANASITVSARDRAGIPVSLTLLAEVGVKVPSLYGMTVAEAKAAIEAAGLTFAGSEVGPNSARKPSDVGRVESYYYGGTGNWAGKPEDGLVKPGSPVRLVLWAAEC